MHKRIRRAKIDGNVVGQYAIDPKAEHHAVTLPHPSPVNASPVGINSADTSPIFHPGHQLSPLTLAHNPGPRHPTHHVWPQTSLRPSACRMSKHVDHRMARFTHHSGKSPRRQNKSMARRLNRDENPAEIPHTSPLAGKTVSRRRNLVNGCAYAARRTPVAH